MRVTTAEQAVWCRERRAVAPRCDTVWAMRDTLTDHVPLPRRPRAAALDNDLRAELARTINNTSPETVAARAEVSATTVRRAATGCPVSPPVRAALARAVGATPARAA